MDTLRSLVSALAVMVLQPVAAESHTPWQLHVREASLRFGIPEPWIMRVLAAESGGRTEIDGRPIRSHAGAMGLMQLMPGTWLEMKKAYGLGANPDDPRDNIIAGTAYLRLMYDRFGYPGLFSAYNAGPARYATHLAHGTPLPRETITYLAKVTGSMDTSSVAEAAPAQTLFITCVPYGSEQGTKPSGQDDRVDGIFSIRREWP